MQRLLRYMKLCMEKPCLVSHKYSSWKSTETSVFVFSMTVEINLLRNSNIKEEFFSFEIRDVQIEKYKKMDNVCSLHENFLEAF